MVSSIVETPDDKNIPNDEDEEVFFQLVEAATVMGMDNAVDTKRLEALLFKHGEHWPGYDHDAKCLYLRKILKFILKYPHHDKSVILGKKIEYLIEYKCNKVGTTTTVSDFHIILC